MEVLHSDLNWRNKMIFFYYEKNCFQLVRLLVFHSRRAKAVHQLNGMITAQLFPFGNTDTWRWNLGLAKVSYLCHCVVVSLCMYSDIICLFNDGLFRKRRHQFFLILSAVLFFFSVQARETFLLSHAFYCEHNPP